VHSRVLEDFDVSFFSSFPGDPVANEGRVAHIRLVPNSTKVKGEGVKSDTKQDLGTLNFEL
jgi:hypothetical protein